MRDSVLLFGTAFLFFGVGGGGSGCGGGQEAPVTCARGDTRACVGPGQCPGGQICGGDGWSACDCGQHDAGAFASEASSAMGEPGARAIGADSGYASGADSAANTLAVGSAREELALAASVGRAGRVASGTPNRILVRGTRVEDGTATYSSRA